MPQLGILRELLTIIIVSLVVVQVVRRVKVPTVVGFLLAGVLLGPGGLGIVPDRHRVEILAEFGVALLLFVVGLRFSLREMLSLRHIVFGAGVAQVVLTIAAGLIGGRLLGLPTQASLLVGFLISLSSTAIVLKLQDDRGEGETLYGRLSLSILILQDLAIVPLLLLVPMLGNNGGSLAVTLLTVGKSLALVVLLLLASRLIVPRVLELAISSRSPETLVLTTLAIAMGTAYLSGLAGLSLALGAFLAGIVISETHYAHHVAAQVLPLRDTLGSLFFISVGMMAEPATWGAAPGALAGLTLAVIVIKASVVLGVALIFRLGWRTSLAAGLALAQVGELSFLIAGAAGQSHILDDAQQQLFVSVSVLTMFLTPWLMALGTRLTVPRSARRNRADQPAAGHGSEGFEALTDHVVIVGYGINGRNVRRALEELGVECVVVELNPRTARELRDAEVPLVFGNACQETTLRRAGVPHARALVIAIADPVAVRCITAAARHLSHSVRLIVRTRFLTEVEPLRRLGADHVVPEEFETSLQLVTLSMGAYAASEQDIERFRTNLRAESYQMLRATVPMVPAQSAPEGIPPAHE